MKLMFGVFDTFMCHTLTAVPNVFVNVERLFVTFGLWLQFCMFVKEKCSPLIRGQEPGMEPIFSLSTSALLTTSPHKETSKFCFFLFETKLTQPINEHLFYP